MAGVLSKAKHFENVFAWSFRKLLLERSSNISGKAPVKSRSFFTFREEAPSDPQAHGQFLRDLNRRGESEAVIRAFESGSVTSNERTLGEYVKALARTDRLDGSALVQTLQRGAQQQQFATNVRPPLQYGAAAETTGLAGVGGTAGAQAAAAGLGSAKNPIYVSPAELSIKSQLWKTGRLLLGAFVVVSAVGALFEDKGLARGLLNNPELRPQLETNTKFADVKGVDEAKAELEEIVEYLRNPRRFTSLGGKLPKGVLLVGPPGTGKTMLARAIAGEAGVPFFYASGSEFEEMFVGVGARRVRDLFQAAKKSAPCIVFIDEIDAIGGRRNPKDQMYMKMTLNQLLVELDGFKPNEGVIVIAATNFAESLDKALVRPGRFDRTVVVPRPDIAGRKAILEVHFRNVPRAPNVDISVIARGTPGFSGADLANLVNVGALQAASKGHKVVTMDDMEYARDRIMMGAERKHMIIKESERRMTAYHEGGHALVALHSPGADPIHKATIVPRGAALGMVQTLPEDDQLSVSKRQMLAKLAVMMGGRVAEQLIFGEEEISNGASSDLHSATELARRMVTKYGFSPRVGTVSLDYDEYSKLSSETRAVVEEEVKVLLSAAYETATRILKKHEAELHAVANELLDKETLTGEQVKQVVALINSTKGPATQ